MSFVSSFGTLFGVWIVVHMIIKLLEYFWQRETHRFMLTNNIKYFVGYVRWTTQRFNYELEAPGMKSQLPGVTSRLYFNAGVICGLLCAFCGVGLLLYNLVHTIWAPSAQHMITPIIPGVNVPATHLIDVLLCVIVCGIWHELGHAIAAYWERCRMQASGIVMVIVYPGAFVDLNAEDVEKLSPIAKLRIYCAGVWHNMILVGACAFLLYVSPMLWSLLYQYDSGGVSAFASSSSSPLSGEIAPFDAIVAVDNCVVHKEYDWIQCLNRVIHEEDRVCIEQNTDIAYCQPDMLATSGNSVCVLQDVFNSNSHTDCCVQDTREQCFFDKSGQQACLRRSMYASVPQVRSSACWDRADVACDANSVCMAPKYEHGTRNRLLYLTLSNDGQERVIAYRGTVLDLHKSVYTSRYRLRKRFQQHSFVWFAYVPVLWERFLSYCVSISAALAILNAVPASYTDGEYIIRAFAKYCNVGTMLPNMAIRGGSMLLIANIGVALIAAVY